jgi:phosphoglycerol transferase MdoB-like AlkP superfamily enzyme
LFVFFYTLIANLPLWTAARLLGVSVFGLFNIEYIGVGILSLFVRRRWTICVLSSVILLDVAYSIGKTYLLSPTEVLEAAPGAMFFIRMHPWSLTAIVSAVIAVCILVPKMTEDRGFTRERLLMISALLAVACMGTAIDYRDGMIAASRPDRQLAEYRIFRNSLHRIAEDEMLARGEKRRLAKGMSSSLIGASAKILPAMFSNPGTGIGLQTAPHVVLVLVESWGLARSQPVQTSLLSSYQTKEFNESYTLSTGTVPFDGATVSGELRELCGNTLGLAVMSTSASNLKGCLPERMRRMGYRPIAIHGFDGAMFERSSWYPKLQFQETWFQAQLKEKGLPECPGPIPGICDAAIATWIGDRLDEAQQPHFIYWVTLNSHLPVPVSNKVKDPPSCTGIPALSDDAICAWYRLIFNVHRSIAELALRERDHPTEFVVVGDHAPPFASEERRSQFSPSVVPYLVLSPKCVSCNGGPVSHSIATALPVEHKRSHESVHKIHSLIHQRTHGM